MQRAALILAIAASCSPALAQQAPTAPVPAPAPGQNAAGAPAAPPAPDVQRTTVSFGDWTLRCVRPEHAAPSCEVGQSLLDKGQPFAQTAFGRPRPGEPMRLTIVVPVNVDVMVQPRLVGAASESGTPPIPLSWHRCIPAGCFADGAVTDEQLRRLRTRTENARVLFQDAGGREVPLPFGPRGLSQALDALAKEG